MTIALSLSCACSSVRNRVEWLADCIRRGGFATSETMEVIDLDHAIAALEQLTAEIRQQRTKLTENVPPYCREAAE